MEYFVSPSGNDINPAVGIDRTVGSWWHQHNRRPLWLSAQTRLVLFRVVVLMLR